MPIFVLLLSVPPAGGAHNPRFTGRRRRFTSVRLPNRFHPLKPVGQFFFSAWRAIGARVDLGDGRVTVIDLHNHILPGIDDGAANLAESIAIARQFVEEGVRTIAATPHLDPVSGNGATPETVRRLVIEVQAGLEASGVDLLVAAGNELFLTPAATDLLKDGRALPLGESCYVLIEVSLTSLERPMYLDDAIFRMQLSGFQPILAHPERYPFVQRDIGSLDGLLERGIVLQLTTASLLGEYGWRIRKTAERLLKRGAYSLAASDRHHPGPSRSLALLHGRLAESQGLATADLLLRVNPARVLEGKMPCRPDPVQEERPPLLARLFGQRPES